MNNLTKSLVVLVATSIISLAISMLVGRPTTEASTIKPFPLRQFYLTQGTFDGASALTACTTGYHMASLWEIKETSGVRYETTLGINNDDSGSGPPAGIYGWIRTGYSSSGSGYSGQTNCRAWTSNSYGDLGADVATDPLWDATLITRITPWTPRQAPCSGLQPVWCVQD